MKGHNLYRDLIKKVAGDTLLVFCTLSDDDALYLSKFCEDFSKGLRVVW